MRIHKTGPFGFGLMYHVIHVGDDVRTLNAWYRDVFDADVWWGADEPRFSEIEDRYAALLNVSDLCVEPMAPVQPANGRYPVGRFYLRRGPRFHSLAFMVDDIEGYARYLLDQGVYIGLPGGGRMEQVPPGIYYFYPSPRSMGGLLAQITRNTDGTHSDAVRLDPRLQDDWDVRQLRWSSGHPLGIERLAYATMAVADLDASFPVFEKLWLAVPVEEDVDRQRGVRSCYVRIGDLLLELASPLRDDGPLAAHLAQHGDELYQLAFLVRDLDAAAEYLESAGVRTHRETDTRLVADPADCHGADYAFVLAS